MYKLAQIKEGINGFYIDDKYVVYIEKKLQGKIKVEKHTNEIVFLSKQEWINRFCIINNYLCYSSYDEDFTRVQNLIENKNISLDVLLFGITYNSPNIYNNLYYNLSEKIGREHNSIYDLFSGNKLKNINKLIIGFIELNTSKHIITKKDTHIYTYQKSDFSLLWQKDISEITQYTEWDNSKVKGEIREIYSYKDSIIVLTQVFILRINPHTGEIIYSLRLPAGLMTLSIENQKAYGCYGYHYMEIDLEKGTLINFIRIEETIYEGKSYNATMNKATFHNGYIFHGLRLEGGQYAVGTINTQTGKREWVSLLKTNMVEKIQFHQDKMFISDSGGNLFIYEKI